MKQLMWVLTFLLALSSAQGAIIQGNVYDDTLELQQNALVTIDTTPAQQYVAKNGSYSFSVPEGSYTLEAKYVEGGLVLAQDMVNVTVAQDGTFVHDFILFQVIDEDLLEGVDSLQVDVESESDSPPSSPLLALLYVALGVLVAVLMFQMWKRAKRSEPPATSAQDDLAPYIDFIKKHKRVTQKEIRKEFPLSEAKISLIITELESKGLVRKVKKGRGNVIIYSG